jgi:Flp pilus assembly protein CpaB
MRASTLFALAAALIVGLGVASFAKFTGFFNQTPAPAPPPAAKKQEIQVLVAARNLFAGDMIDSNGVKVRQLRAEELDGYQKTKDQYLPPVVQAAVLRVAVKNIYADQPILKESLKDMVKPEPLNKRLLPEMRAINLSVPKDRSAGGQIQLGEWVDVFLTSELDIDHRKSVRTACIVPKAKVISKRNTLWPVFAPLPDNKLVDFTLEVNSYRAALVESVRSKGDITLVPLPGSEQRQLDVQRDHLLQNPDVAANGQILAADSSEAEEEEARIAAFKKGELVVGESDLVRIFGLRTAAPPLNTITVERINGAQRLDPAVLTATGVLLSDGSRRAASAATDNRKQATATDPPFSFQAPDCPTCGKNTNGKKATK